MSSASVYRCMVQEGYEWVLPTHESDYELLYSFDGTPRSSGWEPVPVFVLRQDDDGVLLSPADLPWLGHHTLVLNERAVSVLGEALSAAGELLPLRCDDGDYWIFNALTVLDALDEERSELVRFSSGRILKIVRPTFRPERIHESSAFKVSQMRKGSLFVTENVVEEAKRAALLGTIFELAWRSEGE